MSLFTRSIYTTIILGVFTFGLITPVRATQSPVLFDQGHAQMFTIDGKQELDLSNFARLFNEAGTTPTAHSGTFNDASLADCRALIISGPFAPFTETELAAILKFVERGGRLAIMLHIGPPAARLIERLGVNVANGVVRESENILDGEPLNFTVAQLGAHPVFSGIESFNIYGSWPLLSVDSNTQPAAESSTEAWVDLNRNNTFDQNDVRQSFALVVGGGIGSGEFLIFGDDAIFQNRFLTGNNTQLARNLVRWLTE